MNEEKLFLAIKYLVGLITLDSLAICWIILKLM